MEASEFAEIEPEIPLISPDGMRVRTSDFFECPKEIILGPNGVSFDGWVFRTDEGITKSAMVWLIRQTTILIETIGEERAMAVLDGVETQITSKSPEPDTAAGWHSVR